MTINKIIKYFPAIAALLLLGGCNKENDPEASDNLGIKEMFSPGNDESTRVKNLYTDYGVWVRTYFSSVKELTNAILAEDPLVASRGAINLDPERKDEVAIYTETLLSNVSKEFANSFFPLEFFFVKQYGASYWIYPVTKVGRSRLIVMWPSTLAGTIEVTDPVNHYYRDSVLTTRIWETVAGMVTARMEYPIQAFAAAGKAYDNGKAYDAIQSQYYIDYDLEAYNAAMTELAVNGGYISGSGSRDFRTDFSQWIKLVATESYENIKSKHLDTSPSKAAKYQILIDHCKKYNWDIQAAGNKFRQKFNEYKASL